MLAASRATRRQLARQRLARRGFTMVEVMMGLSILAIGSVAVIALQKYAAMGTMTSRHLTSASAISAGVLEAVAAESNGWPALCADGACNNTPTGAEIDTMPWLGNALKSANGKNLQGDWTAASVTGGVFNGFTMEGVAQDPAVAAVAVPRIQIAYCSHVRLTWIGRQLESAAGAGDDAQSVRVDVRTFYAKSGRDISDECTPTKFTIAEITTLLENVADPATVVKGRSREEYGVVMFSTIIRRPST